MSLGVTAVAEEIVQVGKYTLESLTTGMYSDPKIVYREFNDIMNLKCFGIKENDVDDDTDLLQTIINLAPFNNNFEITAYYRFNCYTIKVITWNFNFEC